MADRDTTAALRGAAGAGADRDGAGNPDRDRLDEQEDESFPASDPHSDWAGGPSEPTGE
jgi:hypothetical protein